MIPEKGKGYVTKKGNKVWVNDIEYINCATAERTLGFPRGAVAKKRLEGKTTYRTIDGTVYKLRFEK